MVPLIELQYARKYPFSTRTKGVVKQLSPSLDQLEQEHFAAAFELILASTGSSKEKHVFVENHFSKRDLTYTDFLARDIMAIPLSKILLSYLKQPVLYDRFSSLMADLTFEYLVNEKDKVQSFLDLAQELGMKVDVSFSKEEPRILIPFAPFLSIPLHDGQLHLVNQSMEKGKVVLEMNLACRWLAECVHAYFLSSLPVPIKGIPPVFEIQANELRAQLNDRQRETQIKLGGNVDIPAFPPCMEKIYGEITSGVNIPHMARFDLATFLVNIHMPYSQIVTVFSKASNYDERTTKYHLDNLSGKTGKKYSAPSCAKVREHGLCISRTCNVTHPLQFYDRESGRKVVLPPSKTD